MRSIFVVKLLRSLIGVWVWSRLIANNGTLTTSQIVAYLDVSKPTALRTMTELKATGLVDMTETGEYYNAEKEITLKDKFGWFLTEGERFHESA